MYFISNYILFLLKILTIFILFFLIIFLLISTMRKKNKNRDKLNVISLNNYYKSMKNEIFFAKLSKNEKKIWDKNKKNNKKNKFRNFFKFIKIIKTIKTIKNNNSYEKKSTLYVLDFKGGIQAVELESLRQEISAIILAFKKGDEVLLRLESGGGVVHGYGLAAEQLNRLRKRSIYLTISVDKIAASGGYMMACVANKIIGAPFSIIGSIGVAAQIPNFYKFLEKNNIDIESHTAGEYKRTLTVFGKNTAEAREKFRLELSDIHNLFKEFVCNMRPSLNVKEVFNGKYWFGSIALKKGLIDKINTSDDFIISKMENFTILNLKYMTKKPILKSLIVKIQKNIKNIIFKILKI
ncbi:MAG: protease SohB [Buchnera aphidicola (Nurudea yanoniella)]